MPDPRPAGFYPAPDSPWIESGPTLLREWDGTAWTHKVRLPGDDAGQVDDQTSPIVLPPTKGI